MLKEYDFSDAIPNPYPKLLKRQITINLDSSTVSFFKKESANIGVPYQTLINLYLRDCVENNRKINISWE